jgi:hypothetical protein
MAKMTGFRFLLFTSFLCAFCQCAVSASETLGQYRLPQQPAEMNLGFQSGAWSSRTATMSDPYADLKSVLRNGWQHDVGRPVDPYADQESALCEMQRLFGNNLDDGDAVLSRILLKGILAAPLLKHGNALQILVGTRKQLISSVTQHYAARHARLKPIKLPPGALAIDFHVHTCYSHDSVADIRQILETAASRGLSGIAITDHNTIEGARQARKIADKMIREKELPATFLVIEGEEVSSLQGHILGLFLTSEIRLGMTAAQTIVAIHRAGGLAVAAHPRLVDGVEELANTLPFDAVETANGAEQLQFAVATPAAKKSRSRFYDSITKPRTGGSDAHDPEAVGLCYTMLESAATTDAVRQAILAGRTSACFGLSDSKARKLTLFGPLGILSSLRTFTYCVTGGLGKALGKAVNADSCQISILPPWGVTLAKSF